MAQLFTNNASSTIVSSVLAADTAVTVTSSAKFAYPGGADYQVATLTDAARTQYEVVHITANDGVGNLTILRAQEGTTAANFTSGSVLFSGVTAGTLTTLAGSSAPTSTAPISTDGNANLLIGDPTTITVGSNNLNNVLLGNVTTNSWTQDNIIIAGGINRGGVDTGSNYTIQIGASTVSGTNRGVSIGDGNTINGNFPVVVGYNNYVNQGDHCILIGNDAIAVYNGAVISKPIVAGKTMIGLNNAYFDTFGAESIIRLPSVNLGVSPAWAASTNYTVGATVAVTVYGTPRQFLLVSTPASMSASESSAVSEAGYAITSTGANPFSSTSALSWLMVASGGYVYAFGNLPDRMVFVVTEVGLVKETTSAGVTASVSFGSDFNAANILTSTSVTFTTAAAVKRFAVTDKIIEGNGSAFRMKIATAGTGECLVTPYFKGFFMQAQNSNV